MDRSTEKTVTESRAETGATTGPRAKTGEFARPTTATEPPTTTTAFQRARADRTDETRTSKLHTVSDADSGVAHVDDSVYHSNRSISAYSDGSVSHFSLAQDGGSDVNYVHVVRPIAHAVADAQFTRGH